MQRRPRNPLRTALAAVAILWAVVGAGLGAAWWRERDRNLALQVGRPAPLFSLPDQDGHTHRLADYRGRPVALAFCSASDARFREEVRGLNAAIREFDTLGMKVFAVTTRRDAAQEAHEREGLEYPVLVDEGGRVAAAYGAPRGAPEPFSVVIGPDGRVLLPIREVHAPDHGRQIVELTECCLDRKGGPSSELLGQPVADFRLPSVADGKPVALRDGARSLATVVVFVSARCPCSGHYDARLRDLAARYRRRGVRFLAVDSSDGETLDEIRAHARQAGYPFPVLRDEGNVVADRLRAQVTPEAFALDAQGVLRYHGRIDDSRDPATVTSHDLRNALDFLVAGRPPARPEVIAFGCAIARARNASLR